MMDASRFEGAAREILAAYPEPGGENVVQMPSLWHRALLRNSNGSVKPILANAITALSQAPEWTGLLLFNDFAVRAQTKRETPWGKPSGEFWADNDDRRTAEWL